MLETLAHELDRRRAQEPPKPVTRAGPGLGVSFLDGVYVTQGAFDAPTFLPAVPLSSKEVKRVHKDIITRVRRVLVKHDLDPLALGVPPQPKRKPKPEVERDSIAVELEDSPEYKQPLLDFGDARDGEFFPGLKARSVPSSSRSPVVP